MTFKHLSALDISIMRCLKILIVAAAVLIVAVPMPKPQGTVTNPVVGTLVGLTQGITNINSLLTALPAVIRGLSSLELAATTVTHLHAFWGWNEHC
jgi:hypothetical protein